MGARLCAGAVEQLSSAVPAYRKQLKAIKWKPLVCYCFGMSRFVNVIGFDIPSGSTNSVDYVTGLFARCVRRTFSLLFARGR